MRIYATINSFQVVLSKNNGFQKTTITQLFTSPASRQIFEINDAITMLVLRLCQL